MTFGGRCRPLSHSLLQRHRQLLHRHDPMVAPDSYPETMPGDVTGDINRFNDATRDQVINATIMEGGIPGRAQRSS